MRTDRYIVLLVQELFRVKMIKMLPELWLAVAILSLTGCASQSFMVMGPYKEGKPYATVGTWSFKSSKALIYVNSSGDQTIMTKVEYVSINSATSDEAGGFQYHSGQRVGKMLLNLYNPLSGGALGMALGYATTTRVPAGECVYDVTYMQTRITGVCRLA